MRPQRTCVVYPPCDTAALAALPLERSKKDFSGRLVLSLAQPEPRPRGPVWWAEVQTGEEPRAAVGRLSELPLLRFTGSALSRDTCTWEAADSCR